MTLVSMRIRPGLIASLGVTALLLAGCDRSPPPPPPETQNDVMEAPAPDVPATPPPQIVELPRPEPEARPKPAPEISPDQQVQDDADATGMTARVDRGGGDDAGESQPASGGGNSQDR